MALKLYGIPMSTCTTRAMICLHEKEVEFELVPVDLYAGEHKQPSYLSKNPFGQVPLLEDDDLTLFESRAITRYVSEKYEKTGIDLLRRDSIKEAALVNQWVEIESQHYNPVILPIIYEIFVSPITGQSPDKTVIDANVEKLGKVLDIYEDRLSNNKYLAGDFYSLADLHHLSYTYYMMKTEWASLINTRPHVKAWWEDISSRPAFIKVAEGMTFN
ncbi:hypothetical protein C5167_020922 [Papaver somniferum]|uniref:glutathione transferase n=1 Tax=Papaver somniferum TaxID=3469 RepID=A0A4Y7IXM7_PAPSO|nr:glutathione S-transferase F13-like [Papaver somniferum]RZC52501.1 hypothetical protein C5167_020922 [Papaver somniferum]